MLPAEIATSLVMVLNELLHQRRRARLPAGDDEERRRPTGRSGPAAGRWWSRRTGSASSCTSRWPTTGAGLPADFEADAGERLGLQIVRALATGELRGTIELRNRAGGGTEAVLVVPLGKR